MRAQHSLIEFLCALELVRLGHNKLTLVVSVRWIRLSPTLRQLADHELLNLIYSVQSGLLASVHLALRTRQRLLIGVLQGRKLTTLKPIANLGELVDGLQHGAENLLMQEVNDFGAYLLLLLSGLEAWFEDATLPWWL